jgi:hypothetical protein
VTVSRDVFVETSRGTQMETVPPILPLIPSDERVTCFLSFSLFLFYSFVFLLDDSPIAFRVPFSTEDVSNHDSNCVRFFHRPEVLLARFLHIFQVLGQTALGYVFN